ncbi:MAG: leucine-rich repeat protein [Clostridia bacterium]|nr:leucine-rich repeat protein [Clostridia bacterium]
MTRKAKLIATIFSVVLISLMFSLFTFAENINGHFDWYYNGKRIVNNDWTLDTDSGILTIISKTEEYNETGTGQNGFSGSWFEHADKIKKVVLDGVFAKVSNNAFKGYKNLEEVVITEKVNQIDANAFMGCSALHTIYIGTDQRREGMADLHNVKKISDNILNGTAIKSIYIGEIASSISQNALPASLTTIYGTKGSLAESFAISNGYTFVDYDLRIKVDIYLGDYLCKSLRYIDGDRFDQKLFEFNGKIYTVYSDKSCTVPFDDTQPLMHSVSLYAKPVLSFDGWSVRVKSYKGLRSIFECDTILNDPDFGIVEVGAIVAHRDYALDEFNMSNSAFTKVTVYKNGEKVGYTLGAPKDGKESFAVTVVGFEGEKSLFAERALKNTVFRGFITLKDSITGLEKTYYTDAIGTTLRAASLQYLKNVSGTSTQKAFVRETISLTEPYCNEVRYDKAELMSVITDIYNDNGKILVGEEISPNNTAATVKESFKNGSGQYPSIIGMDLACYGIPLMTCSDSYRTEFLKALIDYCREGGIITASSHFQNPTGNWTDRGLCRGYLGEAEIWDELLSEGSALNRQLKAELDVNADFLRELGNNDVPILWRPFHEMNGGWFWWCITQENGYKVPAEKFKALWRYVYNYYEDELGLTNLIWVYSPNNNTGSLVDVNYSYPGDKYVDMTGLDWYSSGKYEIGSGSYKQMMAHGMPVAITEYGGTNGDLDSIETWNDIQRMYSDGMKITYIMTWTGDHRFTSAGKAAELMSKPDTLSRDEVFKLFKAEETK